MGKDWINSCLPHYVAIERKPKYGCKIQTACCGTSGIMMSLHVVKKEVDKDKTLNHGLNVQACIELYKRGWRFIGVVKMAH
jgi:hypothetical protein